MSGAMNGGINGAVPGGMRLRAIHLENVRRFTTPVAITGIGDGLNVLSAPNESGKSTVFDALQALFFKPHSSTDKEVRSLRPHASGAPQVRVEIETAEGRFTLSKRWLNRAEAKVERDGQLIAQASAAEEWISRRITQGGGGPAGLIWVRQGMTALTSGDKRENDAALEARRNLMLQVGEELEAMTGGRRMAAALSACESEILRYLTDTGRPKKGGPWAEAQRKVEALEAEQDALARMAEALHGALEERQRRRRTLADLVAEEAIEARAARLAAAEHAHQEAERHAQELAALEARLVSARERAAAAQERLERQKAALSEAGAARVAVAEAREALARILPQWQAAGEASRRAEAAVAAAQARLEAAETTRRRAELAERARQSAAHRKALIARLEEAEAARRAMEEAKAAIRGPDAAVMVQLEALQREVEIARRAREERAPQLIARPLPGREAAILLEGQALEAGRAYPVTRPICLTLEGIGQIDLRPAEAAGEDAVAQAETALAEALAALDLPGLEAARHLAAARREAERRREEAERLFCALAPGGTEALRREIAELPAPEALANAVDLPAAEADFTAAREAAQAALARREAAAAQLAALTPRKAALEAQLPQAEARLARAEAALAATEAAPEALAEAAERLRQEFRLMEAEHAARRAEAPDLAVAAADLARAREVQRRAEEEIVAETRAIAVLDERIRHATGDAVEERLADTAEALAAARADLARIEHEVAVLKRLREALTAARSQARDLYFKPVANELRPLLDLLWPEAELQWEEGSLLPEALIRDGQKEPIEILSGGTREQIALMVRLAFARLLARAGTPVPVILDDALIFTDDDRIERMFGALYRQAQEMQILVFTCRQRAFRALGGQALRLEPARG